MGWARPNVRADTELGADELAYVFNGNKVSLQVPSGSRKKKNTALENVDAEC